MLCIYPSHQSKNGCVPFSEFLDLKHRLRPSFEIVATPGPIKLLTQVKSCRLRDDEKSENAQFSASILCQRASSAFGSSLKSDWKLAGTSVLVLSAWHRGMDVASASPTNP